MSRSGYDDDYGSDYPNQMELYRQAVTQSIKGRRGQAFLRRLRDALDAVPTKRLVAHVIHDDRSDVCALGALDRNAPGPVGDDYDGSDGETASKLATHFGIARSLAAEIVYMNDEFSSWRSKAETPEERWVRMRAWVDSEILLVEKPSDSSDN